MKTYPIAPEHSAARLVAHHRAVRVPGGRRPIAKGEWFLSGAIPEAYEAFAEMANDDKRYVNARVLPICAGCKALLWQLGGDPLWSGLDHSQGKPGTTITNDSETREVPACLECANDRETHKSIAIKHGLAGDWRVTRDGAELWQGSEAECMRYLHRSCSASIHHATTYEGYTLEPTKEAS